MREEVLRTFGMEYERHRVKRGLGYSRPYGWLGIGWQPEEKPDEDRVIGEANRTYSLLQENEQLKKELAQLREKKRVSKPQPHLGMAAAEGEIEKLIIELTDEGEQAA